MGTGALFVFTINGKAVAQIETMSGGAPEDFPCRLAQLLHNLSEVVLVHRAIPRLLADFKGLVKDGFLVMAPIARPYDTHLRYPFCEQVYIVEFGEDIMVDVRNFTSGWVRMTVPQFCKLCGYKPPSGAYTSPTLKYTMPTTTSDCNNLVIMLSERGEPLFIASTDRESYKEMESFALRVTMIDKDDTPVDARSSPTARGGDHLALQLLSKAGMLAEMLSEDAMKDTCASVTKRGVFPLAKEGTVHVIGFFRPLKRMQTAVHDDVVYRNLLPGIYSVTQSGSGCFKKKDTGLERFETVTYQPSIKFKCDPESEPLNHPDFYTIVMKTKRKGDALSPDLHKLQTGIHLFETSVDRCMIFFDDESFRGTTTVHKSQFVRLDVRPKVPANST